MKDDYNLDDAFDDAAAAYKEVAAKSEAPVADKVVDAPAPKEVEAPVKVEREQPVKFAKDEPKRGADADKKMYPSRDKDGKFAKADEKAAETAEVKAPVANKPADPAVVAKAADKPADAPLTPATPPPSWSVKAKAKWDATDPDIKAEVIKREQEAAQGLAALKDYRDLKPYAELAKQHGTSISKALDTYIGIERQLKTNLPAGIAQIVQNYGLNHQQAAKLFTDMAAKISGAAPQGNQQPQSPQPSGDPLLDALRPVFQPLMQEINGLKSSIAADRNAAIQAHQDGIRTQQMGTLSKAIDAFASDPANKFFPNLEEHITKLFETGMVPFTGDHAADLRLAYDTAANMHPEVREALIEQRLQERQSAERKKEQEAADKARFASRSVTGSRVPGTVIHERQEATDHDDVEADVRRAIAQTRRA